MDFQEVASPSRREKVDIAQQIRDKEENSSKWNHRKSLAWDSAFSTTPGVLDHEELFGSLKLAENEMDVNHKDSIKTTFPTEIAARPSFAWDNAFFTEPGVLDAEELSLVNEGFASNNTQPRNSADSMMTTTAQEGSRFSVSSIEFDLFNHLRASLSNSSQVKQTAGAQEIQRKLPDGKKRTKWYKLKGSHPLSLIPQPKVYPSSSSLIPKSLTPSQAKPEKKIVASELGRKKGKHKDNGYEEKSASESIIRSSYSGYTVNDLTSSSSSSSSSGLRLPLPKMGFFDSEENGEKENRNPNGANRSSRRHKSTSSPPENRSVLGQRKKRK